MQLPVTLHPQVSASLASALVAAHVAAAWGLLGGLPQPLKPVVGLALLISLAYCLWRHILRVPVMALLLKADGALEIAGNDNEFAAARIHPLSTALPWLVILLLRTGERSLALVLPPDALDAESHRQLRLWLRWKAVTSVAG